MDNGSGAGLNNAGCQCAAEPCGSEKVDVHDELLDVIGLLQEGEMQLAVDA
jgi:hypothetical protein